MDEERISELKNKSGERECSEWNTERHKDGQKYRDKQYGSKSQR